MAFFNLFKKKETETITEENKMLLAMPLFTNENRYDLNTVAQNLINDWNLNVTNVEGNNDTAFITIDEELVALAFIPSTIPEQELKPTAKYAYNWENVTEDIKHIDGHAIVSIMNGNKTNLERYFILSKVIFSILSTSKSIGVYQGSQTLLIPRKQYLDFHNDIKNNEIPIPLWIYIGIRKTEIGNSIYTFGLKDFNKLELEIINSKSSLDEIHTFILNIASYVIKKNIALKDGETIGFTADQKILIKQSEGKYLEGDTLKLFY